MKQKRLIPDKLLCHYPFMYKFLKEVASKNKNGVNIMPLIAGDIPAIQNCNARLETFYKCISRL